MIQTMKCPLVL